MYLLFYICSIINKLKIITMEKHLQTKNYYFLVDIEEGDDNGNTKMYDHTGKLISDNYHASQFLYEIIAGETEEEITFISDEMKYNQTEILKELQND